MKRLAGRQTRFTNKLEGRTGSLWESRYKISPIEADAYFLHCCRYVELNPVKAHIVDRAELYPWSSYAAKLGIEPLAWLDDHPLFYTLGDKTPQRQAAYRAFVESGSRFVAEDECIRLAVDRNQLTGTSRFIDEVERRVGVRVEFRGQGRPVTIK